MKQLILIICFLVTYYLCKQECPQCQIEVNGICKVNDIQLPFNSYQINENLTIYFEYPYNEHINIALTSRVIGFVALGIGNKMEDSDVVVAEIVNNKIVLSDRWSLGYVSPVQDIFLGCTEDYFLLGYQITSELLTVKFQRKLIMDDPKCDKPIIANQINWFIWAQSPYNKKANYHGTYKGIFKLDLKTQSLN